MMRYQTSRLGSTDPVVLTGTIVAACSINRLLHEYSCYIFYIFQEMLDKDDEISDLKNRINRPRSPHRDHSGSFLQEVQF